MSGDGLTRDQLTIVRSWVGTSTEEEVLHDRYNRLQNVDGVIIEELQNQIAEILSSPTSFSAEGVSVDYSENVRQLREQLSKFYTNGGSGLEDTPPKGSGVTVGRLVRVDPR